MIRLLLIATFAALLGTAAAGASDLVIVESGELPIILTASHGGGQDVPGCAVRTPVGSRFSTVRTSTPTSSSATSPRFTGVTSGSAARAHCGLATAA